MYYYEYPNLTMAQIDLAVEAYKNKRDIYINIDYLWVKSLSKEQSDTYTIGAVHYAACYDLDEYISRVESAMCED